LLSARATPSPYTSTLSLHDALPIYPRVIRPAAALRRHPDDVLGRILDVTGLAVHAVGEVDLQPRVLALADELVYRRRAIARLGRSEEHTSELQSRENLVCRLLLE